MILYIVTLQATCRPHSWCRLHQTSQLSINELLMSFSENIFVFCDFFLPSLQKSLPLRLSIWELIDFWLEQPVRYSSDWDLRLRSSDSGPVRYSSDWDLRLRSSVHLNATNNVWRCLHPRNLILFSNWGFEHALWLAREYAAIWLAMDSASVRNPPYLRFSPESDHIDLSQFSERVFLHLELYLVLIQWEKIYIMSIIPVYESKVRRN